MQLAEVRMRLCCKGNGNVFLFPVETEELGNREENVTKSSVGRRHFVAAAPSLYSQTDLNQGNSSTAKSFFWQYPAAFPLWRSPGL